MPEKASGINPEDFDAEKDHEKGDFTDVHNPEFQNELREAGEENKEEKEFELTPEIEEKMIAEAEKHITNIIGYKKPPLPVRFLNSGTIDRVFDNGLKGSSFVVDRVRPGYDREMLFRTVNEGHTQGSKRDRTELLNGKSILLRFEIERRDSLLTNAKSFFDLYKNYLELADTIQEQKEIKAKYDNLLEKYNPEHKSSFSLAEFFNSHPDEAPGKEEMDILLQYEKTIYPDIDPEKVFEMTEKYRKNPKTEDIWEIIKLMIKGKPFSKWHFKSQEIWYDTVCKYLSERAGVMAGGSQIYDMALLIDPDQVDEAKRGYLGDEFEVTAPPKAILREVFIDFEGNIDSDYLIEKMKKIFSQNPELSRPIYDNEGNLLWPRQMSYEEVKKFVAERDAKKKEQ